MSTPDIDNEIREKFLEDLNKLVSGEYDGWKQDKDGKLAAIILADQFPRNMFRRQKKCFDFDHIALGIVKGMSQSEIEQYSIQEQSFLMLPYEHSENILDQSKAVIIAKNLLDKHSTNANE
jgi:uncharacterized protein (DUF924 family)